MTYPKQILIESTTKCQLRCKGCLVGTTPPKDMEWDLMKRLILENQGRGTIVPYMYGEPTLYPHIAEVAELSVDSGARFYIATNGMKWHDELFDVMTEDNQCYQIIFSVDSMNEKKQALCRPGSDLNLITENILRFSKLRESKGRDNIDIAIKIIERGQDYAEIEDFVAFWLAHEYVDYVAVGKMLNAKTEEGMRKYPCLYPNGMYICITVDGWIIPCMYNLDAYRIHALGNIKDMTIEEAYNSPKFEAWRKTELNAEPCVSCGFPYTGSGMTGEMEFQYFDHTSMSSLKKTIGKIHIKTDYYNTFYSRVNKETEGCMAEWGHRQ